MLFVRWVTAQAPNPPYILSGLRWNDGRVYSPCYRTEQRSRDGGFRRALSELRNRPRFLGLSGQVTQAACHGQQRRGFRRNAAGGVLFFGFFLVDEDEHKKETCHRATPGINHPHPFIWRIMLRSSALRFFAL